MIGPRIGPLDPERIPSATLRRIINTLWDLHHQLSLIKPKISEVIGFKKRFINLPLVGLDDLIIEELVSKSGLKIQYLPSKHVYTRVPLSWKEYLSQRRRISAQYINYSLKRNYRASTRDLKIWHKFLLRHNLNLTKVVSIILLMLIEAYALMLGLCDNFRGRDLLKWPAINTTKQ
ncbi:MAG TPA: hypothetical protein PKI44_03990 [Candidatus Omnitrophota bacterium]|nr:hypothetical protein [Candidatus Omnitrophota bacterium]